MIVRFITYHLIPKDWHSYVLWSKELNEAEHYIVCRILANRISSKTRPKWAL
jgi:hypothetical protein